MCVFSVQTASMDQSVITCARTALHRGGVHQCAAGILEGAARDARTASSAPGAMPRAASAAWRARARGWFRSWVGTAPRAARTATGACTARFPAQPAVRRAASCRWAAASARRAGTARCARSAAGTALGPATRTRGCVCRPVLDHSAIRGKFRQVK